MKAPLVALAVAAAAALPLAAPAQAPAGGPPSPGAMRAQFQQAREAARAAMLNDLSADHRAQVQGIVDQVNAGTSSDPRAAAQQIDAILSPTEKSAVVADFEKTMQAAMQRAMPPGVPPRQGPPPGARTPDAGRLLLLTSLTPERMRALRGRRGPRGGVQPAPNATPGATQER